MAKFCDSGCPCVWSPGNDFCSSLSNASVPLDDKWPLFILVLRSIQKYKFLSEEQKRKMQAILVKSLQQKEFTDKRYEEIIDDVYAIMREPFEKKMASITKEVTELAEEANKFIGKHHKSIINVAEAMDNEIDRGVDPGVVISGLRHVLRDMAAKMEADSSTLRTLSYKDPLTGLANRRSFDDFLDQSIELWKNDRRKLVLIIFDVDKFKNFNDSYGHLVGDQVLRTLAKQVTTLVNDVCDNKDDVIVARYGGEEFAIVLRGDAAKKSVSLAEGVRKAIENSPLLLRDSSGNIVESGLKITVSLGIANMWDGWSGAYKDNLIESADKALYRAKNSGRNRTIRFLPEGSEPFETIRLS